MFIHHHLGLGDHIICNGLVRELLSRYGELSVFCKRQNLPTVQYMYRDVPVGVVGIETDDDTEPYGPDILKIGFQSVLFYRDVFGMTWDEAFYAQCGVEFSKRWDSFFVKRDVQREVALCDKLNPDHRLYALVHSTGSDGVNRVNEDYVGDGLLKIEVKKGHTDNLLDYFLLIENASEIHCIDSAFKHLVDSIPCALVKKLFYHNSIVRSAYQHQARNAWITV